MDVSDGLSAWDISIMLISDVIKALQFSDVYHFPSWNCIGVCDSSLYSGTDFFKASPFITGYIIDHPLLSMYIQYFTKATFTLIVVSLQLVINDFVYVLGVFCCLYL